MTIILKKDMFSSLVSTAESENLDIVRAQENGTVFLSKWNERH